MKRKSGAQNRNSKNKKLRDESAALPGQLKISNIFSAKCGENANNDSIEKENRPRVDDNSDGMCYVISSFMEDIFLLIERFISNELKMIK